MSNEYNNENQNYDAMEGAGGMSTDKAKHSGKTVKRLFKALGPQKWALGSAFVFAIGGVLLNLWAPLVFGDAINVIFSGLQPYFIGIGPININLANLASYAMLLAGIYGIAAIFTYYQEYIMASVGQKLTLSLREQVSAKLERVPLKFYDTHKKGEILSRVTNDLERLNEIIKDAIMRLFTSGVTIIGAIILMFYVNWILTLIALGSVILGLVITMIVGVKSNEYFTNRQRSLGKFNTRIEESFSG